MEKHLFLVFTFVIILIILLLSDDVWTALLLLSVLVNLYFIVTYNEDLESGEIKPAPVPVPNLL
jgi:hypothetical protein